MTNHRFLPFLPHLLEEQPELFSNQDLQDLDNTINLLETKSDDEAKKVFSDFLKKYRHIRDELRKLSEAEREIKNLKPSASKQYGVTNVFPQLHQIIKNMKEQRNIPDEPKPQNKTS